MALSTWEEERICAQRHEPKRPASPGFSLSLAPLGLGPQLSVGPFGLDHREWGPLALG
jgi:hypothetical protein